MKADLTRDSFNALRHYSQVLMQQGRVQLDADWNEQGRLLLYQLRAAIADILGPAAGRNSVGWPKKPGFSILLLPGAAAPLADFLIANGRYYVDGILCELPSETIPVTVAADGKSVVAQRWTVDGRSLAVGQYVRVWTDDGKDEGTIARITRAEFGKLTLTLEPTLAPGVKEASARLMQRVTTYRTQADLGSAPPDLPTSGSVLVYLDVWERVVTSLEDPMIREVALGIGGPDTAARVRTIAQVRFVEAKECLPGPQIAALVAPGDPGLLRARTPPPTGASDPCTIDPDAGYRGPENQLYRVEVHTGGSKAPSFKWSRENGSVLYPVLTVASDGGIVTATLANLGRDDRFGLSDGDYVELESAETMTAEIAPPAPLLQVKSVDRQSRQVTLATPSNTPFDIAPFAKTLATVLRRWDHGGAEVGADNAIAIPLTAATGGNDWLDLEDGVQVQFAVLPGVDYRPGDYWQIPARVATGNVIWPQDTWTDAAGTLQASPGLRAPDGIVHHYAPLATLKLSGSSAPSVSGCQTPIGVG